MDRQAVDDERPERVWTVDELVEVLRRRNIENAALREELRRVRVDKCAGEQCPCRRRA